MSSEHDTERHQLEIDWMKAAGGALAAVSSAVLLSTIGVAGTIIGAAVGSVVVTVGNSVYTHYIATSKERVAAAALAAKEKAARTRGRPHTSATSAAGIAESSQKRVDAGKTVTTAEAEANTSTSWREMFSNLPWKRLAVVAAGVFVLAMGTILAFELATGKAVSQYTGGSDSNGPRTSFGGGGKPENTKPSQTGPTNPATTPSQSTSEPTTTTPTEEETTTVPTTTEPTVEETTAPPTTEAPAAAPTTGPAAAAPPTE